jgi:hypothetical protein
MKALLPVSLTGNFLLISLLLLQPANTGSSLGVIFSLLLSDFRNSKHVEEFPAYL